ncbi:MAG TPA: hypothetical protein VIG64_00940 [Actinomycetota bacterium]
MARRADLCVEAACSVDSLNCTAGTRVSFEPYGELVGDFVGARAVTSCDVPVVLLHVPNGDKRFAVDLDLKAPVAGRDPLDVVPRDGLRRDRVPNDEA